MWKIWSAKIGFIQSHLERMIFSDVLWDPNVHSHLLDASAVLVELNSARSTPRTWMPQVSKRILLCAFKLLRDMLHLYIMDYIILYNYIDCRTSSVYMLFMLLGVTPLESEKLVPGVHSAHGVVWWLCEPVDMAPQGTWCPQGAFKSWVKLTNIYTDHIVPCRYVARKNQTVRNFVRFCRYRICWNTQHVFDSQVLVFAVLLTIWTEIPSKSWQDKCTFFEGTR